MEERYPSNIMLSIYFKPHNSSIWYGIWRDDKRDELTTHEYNHKTDENVARHISWIINALFFVVD